MAANALHKTAASLNGPSLITKFPAAKAVGCLVPNQAAISSSELAETFPVLLEVGNREIVNFVLLQEGIHVQACLETQKPAKLRGREGMAPVRFNR
jgi:hypothetical protein